MKKTTLLLTMMLFAALTLKAQTPFKIHSNGRVSFQSTTNLGGVQIDSVGKSSFEPDISLSYTALTQTKAPAPLVKTWNVKYTGSNPALAPNNRFYVTGNGNVYSNGLYSIINESEGPAKGRYPIENASSLVSGLHGYYFDNDEFEGFVPDFKDNPNVAPGAIEGMMKDLTIDRALGLLPSDLEVLLPEAVRHDPEGMVYVNYSALVPVLVEAFKEQQSRIELLEEILRGHGWMEP